MKFLFLVFVVICTCSLVNQGNVRLWKVRGKSARHSGQCTFYSRALRRQESVICSYLLHLVWHHSRFQTAQKNSTSINSLKIRMTSHPCNTYEQITLSYLLSINLHIAFNWISVFYSAISYWISQSPKNSDWRSKLSCTPWERILN